MPTESVGGSGSGGGGGSSVASAPRAAAATTVVEHTQYTGNIVETIVPPEEPAATTNDDLFADEVDAVLAPANGTDLFVVATATNKFLETASQDALTTVKRENAQERQTDDTTAPDLMQQRVRVREDLVENWKAPPQMVTRATGEPVELTEEQRTMKGTPVEGVLVYDGESFALAPSGRELTQNDVVGYMNSTIGFGSLSGGEAQQKVVLDYLEGKHPGNRLEQINYIHSLQASGGQLDLRNFPYTPDDYMRSHMKGSGAEKDKAMEAYDKAQKAHGYTDAQRWTIATNVSSTDELQRFLEEQESSDARTPEEVIADRADACQNDEAAAGAIRETLTYVDAAKDDLMETAQNNAEVANLLAAQKGIPVFEARAAKAAGDRAAVEAHVNNPAPDPQLEVKAKTAVDADATYAPTKAAAVAAQAAYLHTSGKTDAAVTGMGLGDKQVQYAALVKAAREASTTADRETALRKLQDQPNNGGPFSTSATKEENLRVVGLLREELTARDKAGSTETIRAAQEITTRQTLHNTAESAVAIADAAKAKWEAGKPSVPLPSDVRVQGATETTADYSTYLKSEVDKLQKEEDAARGIAAELRELPESSEEYKEAKKALDEKRAALETAEDRLGQIASDLDQGHLERAERTINTMRREKDPKAKPVNLQMKDFTREAQKDMAEAKAEARKNRDADITDAEAAAKWPERAMKVVNDNIAAFKAIPTVLTGTSDAIGTLGNRLGGLSERGEEKIKKFSDTLTTMLQGFISGKKSDRRTAQDTWFNQAMQQYKEKVGKPVDTLLNKMVTAMFGPEAKSRADKRRAAEAEKAEEAAKMGQGLEAATKAANGGKKDQKFFTPSSFTQQLWP